MRTNPGIAALLIALMVVGCGKPSPQRPAGTAQLPADPAARALHCYLLLTLTLEQMAESDGPGRQGGFVVRRGTDELLRARARAAAELDDELLDEVGRDPWPRLEEVLADFDADGDGQLATAAEVDAFNRQVAACAQARAPAGTRE